MNYTPGEEEAFPYGEPTAENTVGIGMPANKINSNLIGSTS